jgi:hypothetical protein
MGLHHRAAKISNGRCNLSSPNIHPARVAAPTMQSSFDPLGQRTVGTQHDGAAENHCHEGLCYLTSAIRVLPLMTSGIPLDNVIARATF